MIRLANFSRFVLCFILLLPLFSWGTRSYSDVIKLKSGRTLTAAILERDDNHVKVDFQGVPLTFYKEEIDSITAESIPAAAPSSIPVVASPANVAPPVAAVPTKVSTEPISDQVMESAADSVVVVDTIRDNLPSLLGTGFFVSRDGLVATNLHVVFKARAIAVKMKDGTVYPVEYIANVDDDRDFCLLKIDIKNAPALPLGDSDQLTTTQKVFTIGHPQAQEYQKAAGQYLGKRAFGRETYLLSTIVSKAGNSGGPLMNSTGQVIGICSSAKADAAGYNYSIPINEVKKYFNLDNLRTIAQFNSQMGKVQELVFEGKAVQDAGENAKAIDFYKQAVALDSSCLKAWIGLGEVYRSAAQDDEGFDAWQEVVIQDPNNAEAHAFLGKVYLNRHQLDESIMHLQKAIQLAPQSVYVYSDLGFAYGKKGMPEEALATYKKAIEIDPQFAEGYYNLAVAYYNKRDTTAAQEYADKAADLGYDVPESFQNNLDSVVKMKTLFPFK